MATLLIVFCIISYVVAPVVAYREMFSCGYAETHDYFVWFLYSLVSPIVAIIFLWLNLCKIINKSIDKIINQLEQQSDEK